MPLLKKLELLNAELHIARQRLENAASLSQDALFIMTPNGQILSWNRAAERFFGYTIAEAIGHDITALLVPEDQKQHLNFLSRVCAGETFKLDDIKHRRKDGTLIDVSITAAPVMGIDGLVESISIAIQDIGRRKGWDAYEKSMTRELAHRVKNSFAILQSILHSTLKNSPEPNEFAKVFSSRLHSLAAAQDALTANDWRGVELGALARHQLAPYDKLDNTKLQMIGPEVYLSPQYAIPFGLIFNELAANSLEHGAWSKLQGKVQLQWHVDYHSNTAAKLHVFWQERGGPKPSAHRKPGFGIVLIEKSLAGALVLNTFEALGLTCTIELDIAPLSDFGHS